MKLITCEFNMDSGCVELRFDDGTELGIDCTVVESEYAHTVQQKTELDWLVYLSFSTGLLQTIMDSTDSFDISRIPQAIVWWRERMGASWLF